jgi:hypothetical protein
MAVSLSLSRDRCSRLFAKTSALGQAIAPEIRYILVLFVVTRVALTIIGVLARDALTPFIAPSAVQVGAWLTPNHRDFSQIRALDIWGVWDTRWYVEVARHGYSLQPVVHNPLDTQPTTYAFFPLYPMLMRAVGILTGDVYVAGLLISNVALLVACVYLFKLVAEEAGDETAQRTLKYVFLYPAAFILSGVFTEALFLALLVLCFYHARRQRWWLVGLLGFALALTRPMGAVAGLALLVAYVRQQRAAGRGLRADALAFVLFPLGWLSFAAFNYVTTGDALKFVHELPLYYARPIAPWELLASALVSGQSIPVFEAAFATAWLLLLVAAYRAVEFPQWLLAACLLLVPLMQTQALRSMPRYILVIFPLQIAVARLSLKHPYLDQGLSASMALLQGFMMVVWTNHLALPV